MKGITDKKGIPDPKLEHIFIGTVKNGKVSGYHCDVKLGDEKLYAEARLYSRSKRLVTANKNQKLFEAVVKEKGTKIQKEANGGKSTFFNGSWSRQEIVDCIDRLKKPGYILKEFRMTKGINYRQVCIDKETGLVVVNINASTFPLIKY
ncbi:EndoU domain-containing protein [Fusibacter bizertensis]